MLYYLDIEFVITAIQENDHENPLNPHLRLAWFELNGRPHPVRMKLDGQEIKIEQIISMTEERLAGNWMLIFKCQSEIERDLRPFELKYELNTCKSYLWKMYTLNSLGIRCIGCCSYWHFFVLDPSSEMGDFYVPFHHKV